MGYRDADLVPFGYLASVDLPAAPTPESLNIAWKSTLIPWAIHKLIETTCFFSTDHDAHVACKEFWEATPDSLRATQFFCLRHANHCVNCAHVWYGALERACPSCGEPYEAQTLQQRAWHHEIAITLGSATAEYESKTRAIGVDIKFRVAQYMREHGSVDFAGVGFGKLKALSRALYSELREMGHEGSDASDAAGWAAFAPEGLPLLEEAGHIAPGEVESWTRNRQRQMVRLLRTTVKNFYKDGKKPAKKGEGDEDFEDRLKEMEAAVDGADAPDIPDLEMVVLNIDSRKMVLAKVTDAQIVALQLRGASVDAEWDVDDDTMVAWLQTLFTGGEGE